MNLKEKNLEKELQNTKEKHGLEAITADTIENLLNELNSDHAKLQE